MRLRHHLPSSIQLDIPHSFFALWFQEPKLEAERHAAFAQGEWAHGVEVGEGERYRYAAVGPLPSTELVVGEEQIEIGGEWREVLSH